MKVLKAFIVVCLISLLAPKAVSAYFTPPDQQIPNFERSVYELKTQYNLPSSVKASGDSLVIWMAQSILGPMTAVGQQAVGPKSGALYALSGLIAEMYKNPPASSAEYFADLGRNLGLISPAYAQGIGFTGLTPILKIWKAFRNIAYVFFIIIFISLGLAIMFRTKIDPKTTITIQNSLPRIVIALILVTFSYAIAGLLIDLIYVLMTIVIAALGSSGLIKDTLVVQEQYLTGGFMNVVGAVFGGGARAIDDLVKFIFPVGVVVGPIIGIIIGAFTGVIPGLIVGAGIASGVIPSILALLILAVVLLYIVFKLFLMLLSSYISVILGVIFSPFQIMLGALPGQPGFGGWVKNMLANILVFPAVAGMLLIGAILTSSNPTDLWSPPMLAFGGTTANAVTGILGLGILLMTPKAAEAIKGAFGFKPGRPPDFGPISWLGKGIESEAQKKFGGYVLTGRLGKADTGGLAGDTTKITEEAVARAKAIGAKIRTPYDV